MPSRLTSRLLLLLLQVAAFQPVWRWYLIRLWDGSDEPWGLLALATALGFLALNRNEHTLSGRGLILPSILMAIYLVTYSALSPLPRAIIAVTAVAVTTCRLLGCSPLHPALWGLFLMSLPVFSSLQFYVGYPMRVVSGALAVPLLQMSGLAVVRDGTCLRWGQELISIDAPCSGIKMLWVGCYLAFTMAYFLRLSSFRTVLLSLASLSAVVVGNALRTATLFQMESGIVTMPAWSHDAVGLVVFATTSMLIIQVSHRIGGAAPCAKSFLS